MAYRYISNTELAQLIRDGARIGKDVLIVDVRDDDYHGGNIPGAVRAPSELRTEASVTELVKQYKDVPRVIFHCALSQVRGPKAARIYAEELARQQLGSATSTGEGNSFSVNPFSSSTQQEVLVLREGFTGWQSLYRKDPALVENFDVQVWGAYAQ
ncbi:M-phase inducer phosphatase, protein tyrosine phosphatase [Pseudohyphozyma bogoriensis]|nr:M-phase inducer phosphatase, protein tyrosine phosphatase [Pseudohyphozyma bogoriensis]